MPNLGAYFGFALFAILFGFTNSGFHYNGNTRTAIGIGVALGASLSGLTLVFESDWLMAFCLFGGSIAGSWFAAVVPEENLVKRFFQE